MIEPIYQNYAIENNNERDGLDMQMYENDCVLGGFRIVK